MMTSLETMIYKTKTMVERWHGNNAKMLELSRSHYTLTVVITGNDNEKNLVIALLEPAFISGPTSWTGNQASLVAAALPNGRPGIALVDEKNGVRILAESFEVAENRKLW